MFPSPYWPAAYWPKRYWPEGEEYEAPPFTPSVHRVTAPPEVRRITAKADA